MKKLPLILSFFILSVSTYGQIGPNDANALLGLPPATDLAEINAILNPQIGSVVYNLDDEQIYRYTGPTNGWQKVDNQNAAEVPLVTDVDVNNVAGDPNAGLETNVEEVVQAIAPITSKAGRVFYPPSIEIDASAISTSDETINLYDQYANQYDITSTSTTINGTLINYTSAKSPSAPNDIPIYLPTDLYYYVTFADTSVFNIISLDDNGLLTYRIVGIPTDDNTIINVVFVVK